jgi:hypothetical protein
MLHIARHKTPFLLLFALAAALLSAAIAKSNSYGELILEVATTHFTLGRQIPSVYLRVYSDGWAECHTVRFTGHEKEKVKRTKLARREQQTLEAALHDPELLRLNNQKYGPMGMVIDSWMEWDIKVPAGAQAAHQLGVTVDNFDLDIEAFDIATEAERKRTQSFPPALLKLGCLIWKVRNEVYGDQTFQGKPLYLTDGCRDALSTQ